MPPPLNRSLTCRLKIACRPFIVLMPWVSFDLMTSTWTSTNTMRSVPWVRYFENRFVLNLVICFSESKKATWIGLYHKNFSHFLVHSRMLIVVRSLLQRPIFVILESINRQYCSQRTLKNILQNIIFHISKTITLPILFGWTRNRTMLIDLSTVAFNIMICISWTEVHLVIWFWTSSSKSPRMPKELLQFIAKVSPF